MEQVKAPEKIYIQPNIGGRELIKTWFPVKIDQESIEYVRRDVFIEKAKKWFEMRNEWINIDGTRQCDMESFEDFRKYMNL